MAILKKYSPRVYFLILAMAVAMRNAAIAAEENKSATTLPEVLVTGQQNKKSYKSDKISSSKYQGPLVDVPQSVTIIPKAVMEDQGATSLREVLRNTPGISMQAGEGGTPAGDQMTIRGFSARTDIFVDNVRDFGGYSRDPFNLEQVEVVKGPASSYSGRGSTGGSVNLVSKSPYLDPSYDATVGFGTDQYQRYTVDVNQPLKGIWGEGTALRINAMYHTNHTAERDIAEDERWGFAPSLAIGIDTPTRLTLSYFYMGQDNMPDYGHPWIPGSSATGPLAGMADQPVPVDRSNFYGMVNRDYEIVETHMGTAQLEHDFTEEVTLRNIFRYGWTYRDSIITPPRFVTNSNSQIARTDWKTRDQVDEIISNQTDLQFEFNTWQLEHKVVTGVDLNFENEVNYARVATDGGPNTDLYNPDPYQPFTGTIARNGAAARADVTAVGVYAGDTIKINEQWELNGGFRWDYFEASIIPTAGTPPVEGQSLQSIDSIPSWRTGIVYKPVPIGSIYAAYGTSFNPSAEGLTLTNTTNTLDPEENETYEVGTKWEFFNKNLNVSSAIFRTTKTNARTPGLPGEAPTVLSGEQQVDGIEFGVAGEINENWSVFGGYTFLDSEVLSSNTPAEVGREVNNTPRNTFNIWTTYQLPFNLEVGIGGQFTDERFNNNTNLRKAPDYWLFDAMVAYKWNKNITTRLNVYNLADEEYIDRMSGGHYIPGAGRSAVVTTSFDF